MSQTVATSADRRAPGAGEKFRTVTASGEGAAPGPLAARVDGVPHLGEVLSTAAVGAGLLLAPVAGEEGTALPSTEDARRRAAAWWRSHDPAPTVVVVVDGLGLELLRERRGHAPTLRSWLSAAEFGGLSGSFGAGSGGSRPGPLAYTCAPSTTAAALTIFGTGALPGHTGMLGYSVLSPEIDREALGVRDPLPEDALGLISWEGTSLEPASWQTTPTIFERLQRDPDRSHDTRGQSVPLAVSIGPERFAGSGLTMAALRGATHLGADRLEDRPALAAQAIRRGTPLVYLYVGELDHAGHAYGWRSQEWLRQLERLDAAMGELERRLCRGARIVLTADHGMVDTEASRRIEISTNRALREGVAAIAGEPRFLHLYVPHRDPERARAVAQRWQEELGEKALWVGLSGDAAADNPGVGSPGVGNDDTYGRGGARNAGLSDKRNAGLSDKRSAGPAPTLEALLGPMSARGRSVVGDVLVAMAENWVVVDERVHSPGMIAMPGVHGSLTEQERHIPLLSVTT